MRDETALTVRRALRFLILLLIMAGLHQTLGQAIASAFLLWLVIEWAGNDPERGGKPDA